MNKESETRADRFDALAGRLAALAHPVRIDILRHLAERDACCCKDMVCRVKLAQSTVSQHLRVLVDSGLVRFEPDRQRSRYTIDRAAVEALAAEVSGMLGGFLPIPSRKN